MKANVMKRAWEIRRNVANELGVKVSAVSMSECLKMAWLESKNSNDGLMTRRDAYKKFCSERQVEITFNTHDWGLYKDVTDIKITSKRVDLSYYDYKNWYTYNVIEKYKKTKQLRDIQKTLGCDVEKIDGTYDSVTKKIGVKGVFEVNNIQVDMNEKIDYKEVVLDLLKTLYKRTPVKGYNSSYDRDFARQSIFHVIFMLSIEKKDIEYYVDKLDTYRKNKEFANVDVMRVVYNMIYRKVAKAGNEHYIQDMD